MASFREAFDRVKQYVEARRISNAAIKSIPYFGTALDEVMHGGDLEKLIESVAAESEVRQQEIIGMLLKLTRRAEEKSPMVICVGGGNAEEVLKLDETLRVGDKHSVSIEELFGGSGVNYSLRLLHAGFDVLPILAIGDDRIGRNIRSNLIQAAKLTEASPFVSDFLNEGDGKSFFDLNIQTSSTTIVVHNARRTIFSQKLRNGEHFIRHVQRRLDDALRHAPAYPSAVMMGHIHSDGNHANPDRAGETTKLLVETFKGKSLVYANFGKSQINLGFEFWQEYLPDIDIFQLNLSEAKAFFSSGDGQCRSLIDIVDTIRDNNMTVVITLDRFGAIGIHKDEPDSIFISWPVLEVKDVVDPTGAGDAFAAGMVSYLCKQRDCRAYDFQSAIGIARLWAAHACRTYGGAGECPDQKAIEVFKEKISPKQRRAVEVRNHDFAREIMTVLDIAFQ